MTAIGEEGDMMEFETVDPKWITIKLPVILFTENTVFAVVTEFSFNHSDMSEFMDKHFRPLQKCG